MKALERFIIPRSSTISVARRILDHGNIWGTYTLDLLLEAVLRCPALPLDLRQIPVNIFNKRLEHSPVPAPPRYSPFVSLEWAVWQSTGDIRLQTTYVDITDHWRKESVRDADGLVVHQGSSGSGILIDHLQHYAARMARAGAVSGDPSFFEECVRQWEGYRKILRDPHSGLWHQGRGWIQHEPHQCSPGTWSRGQGWCLRGLCETLEVLPPDSDFFGIVLDILQDLASALLRHQAGDGTWHRIPDRPPEDSLPDSSGTGMILHYLHKAVELGWVSIPESPLRRAGNALVARITPDGRVQDSCPGPGPLEAIEPYLGNVTPSPTDEPHGPFCAVLAGTATTRTSSILPPTA